MMPEASPGLVSIITPTYNRPLFLERAKSYVLAQKYTNIEWLILDDSPVPCQSFLRPSHANIKYQHALTRLSIGEKRNHLVEQSNGEIIVHFDDDDYYSPDYVSSMLSIMQSKNADLLSLMGWFLLDLRSNFFGYWDLADNRGARFCCDVSGVSSKSFNHAEIEAMRDNKYGYGFTYAFKRSVWNECKFPALNLGEDGTFFLQARKHFRTVNMFDGVGLCLHILHSDSTSRCFPQYRIPDFLLKKMFPQSAYATAINGL